MPNTALYEERRREIMERYTPRLKDMSAGDPAYQALWDARASELFALRQEFGPQAEHAAADPSRPAGN